MVALLIVNTYIKFNGNEFILKTSKQEYIKRYNPKKNTIQQLFDNLKQSPIMYPAEESIRSQLFIYCILSR